MKFFRWLESHPMLDTLAHVAIGFLLGVAMLAASGISFFCGKDYDGDSVCK
jgi:hypothetical protein